MVDWERVEQLRSKGWDWDSIAEDPKAEYTPPEGIEDSGKALKALYYSRKSRGQSKGKKQETKESFPARLKKGLIPIGLTIAIIGLIWFLFALEASQVGVWLKAFPWVLLVAIAGVVIMATGFVMGTGRLSESWKKPVVVGIVVGLVLSGMLALFAASLGIPNLSPNTFQEGTGQGWKSETPRNPQWTSGGNPVLFFYGSLGCMYCAASSWAIRMAFLDGFGTLTNTEFTSSVNDDNVPEVDWCATQVTSQYISWDEKEGCDNTQISEPGTTLLESAYLNAYGTGGVPFYVVDGIFIQTSALVNPVSSGIAGLSYSTVLSILQAPSSNPTVYNAIHTGAQYLEAYLVKADQLANITPPSSVTSDSTVMTYVGEIT
jgi:hypothetical protein